MGKTKPYTADELYWYVKENYPELDSIDSMLAAEEVITKTVHFQLWLIGIQGESLKGEVKKLWEELIGKK